MKKFSQLRKPTRINEQEITLSGQDTAQSSTAGSVTVEINSTPQNSATDTKEETKPEEKTENNEPKQEGSVVKFFSKIFESREMAHVYHLTVKGEEGSHAKHLALGDYYDKILDMLDELIEVYQGEFEVLEGYESIDTSATKSTDAIKYFQDLAEFIKKERKVCFVADATHYFNIIDDMLVLIYKTLYKLKYNK